ncbi:MAG: hypothetical protein HGA45_35675 [Chloroflexales bacterium]|nr:hypothetical protein [Chloroflexales bacterium]
MSVICSRVDTWLIQPRNADDSARPPDDLIGHATGCPRCRGVLLTLFAERLGPRTTVTDTPCPIIEEQLPAFADYERAHGLLAAARAFPDVWWHTQACPRCDELLGAMHELAALPAAPWAASAARQRWLPSLRGMLQVQASLILQLLGMQQRLGAAWGPAQTSMVIAEEHDDIGSVQISMRREAAGGIVLVIETRPPVEGVAVLSIADMHLRAPFDAEGCAVFDGLTESLFEGDAASPLTLRIEMPDLLS